MGRIPFSTNIPPLTLRTVISRLALAILLVVIAFGSARSQDSKKELHFKGVYIFNFIQFVTWPQDVAPSQTLTLGVLGDHPIRKVLVEIFKDEIIHQWRISVVKIDRVEEIPLCQVLFVGRQDSGRVSRILDATRNSSILTIGETGGFAESGGVVNFFTESGKLRFEINEQAATRAGLQISSKLLRLARLVNGAQGGGQR